MCMSQPVIKAKLTLMVILWVRPRKQSLGRGVAIFISFTQQAMGAERGRGHSQQPSSVCICPTSAFFLLTQAARDRHLGSPVCVCGREGEFPQNGWGQGHESP